MRSVESSSRAQALDPRSAARSASVPITQKAIAFLERGVGFGASGSGVASLSFGAGRSVTVLVG